MKFSSQQLLFEQFFDITGNFCSVQPESESIFYFSIIYYFKIYQSFEPPSSTPVGDRHMRPPTFFKKYNVHQFLFETFFDLMRIFSSIEP